MATFVDDIGISEICTAFGDLSIGTKVTNRSAFSVTLAAKMKYVKFGDLGQAYVELPEAIPYVSGGVALRSNTSFSTVCIREHRGSFGVYASRSLAEKPGSLAVVVYTRKAYFNDPEVNTEELFEPWIDYIIVAVLSTPAGVGGDGVMGTYRFTSNLAGGNNKYKPENGYTLDKAISDAKLCLEYENIWMTVAD